MTRTTIYQSTSVSAGKTPAAAKTVAAAVLTGTPSLMATEDPNINEDGSPALATSLPVAGEDFAAVAQMGNKDVITDGSGIEMELESSFGADIPIL